MGWKSNINIHFSKQMLVFHLFLPFILRYVKKVPNLQDIIAIEYNNFKFILNFYHNSLCYNLLTDLFSPLNDQAY